MIKMLVSNFLYVIPPCASNPTWPRGWKAEMGELPGADRLTWGGGTSGPWTEHGVSKKGVVLVVSTNHPSLAPFLLASSTSPYLFIALSINSESDLATLLSE
jgi:hypothetical protein